MQGITKPRRRWLELLSVGYVVLLVIWWLLRLAFFDGLWWLALLNTFALVLFIPLVLLILLALWYRRPWLLFVLAIPLALFVWLFGETLLPPATAGPGGENRATITAMSFNVLWSNDDYDRIAEVIAAADPDIVGFQELQSEHLTEINARLDVAYPYQASLASEGYHTIGLLSRFPIESMTTLDNAIFERALSVRLRVDERPLTVIVAHLIPTSIGDILHTVFDHRDISELSMMVTERFARREQHAKRLLAVVREAEEPALLLCDCNANNTSEVYAVFRSDLQDSFVEAGWGLGNTRIGPLLRTPLTRVDYVWHTSDLQAVRAWVGPDAGSDHRPVIAELAWR